MKKLNQKEIGIINALVEARTKAEEIADKNFTANTDWRKKQNVLDAITSVAGPILEAKGYRVRDLNFVLGECPSSDWIAAEEWGIGQKRYRDMGIKIPTKN